jgi:CBS domain-containing protein
MDLGDTFRSVLKQKGQNVWHISPEACVYDAIEIMADKFVGALLVVSEGNLVGSSDFRDSRADDRRWHENHDGEAHPPPPGS